LKTTPTALKTLRRRPLHAGQVVRASSLKLWNCSNVWEHSVQAYW